MAGELQRLALMVSQAASTRNATSKSQEDILRIAGTGMTSDNDVPGVMLVAKWALKVSGLVPASQRPLVTTYFQQYQQCKERGDWNGRVRLTRSFVAELEGRPVPAAITDPAARPVVSKVSASEQLSPKETLWSNLYTWQQEAVQAWMTNGSRGVVEAVTGSGKTMVGIYAIVTHVLEGFQVLILVPTIDLQDQWQRLVDEWLNQKLRLRASIGRLGGEGGVSSLGNHAVLIATIQSAYRDDRLATIRRGLLLADECHRYGSEEWSRVLRSNFQARLGLTATYQRDDDGIGERLDPYFVGTAATTRVVCYSLGYERAIADDVIARFKIAFVGVDFTSEERDEYETCSADVSSTYKKLVKDYGLPAEPFGEFMLEVTRATKEPWPLGQKGARLAGKFLKAFQQRRQLFARSQEKYNRFNDLIGSIHRADKTIVFADTKEATWRLAELAQNSGLQSEGIVSDMDTYDRRNVLDRFAMKRLRDVNQLDRYRSTEKDTIDVLIAPKLLDEGIDVPAADLGVIVSPSRSRRQMIQRMGRVIRKKDDGRLARIAILFVRGTAEDPGSLVQRSPRQLAITPQSGSASLAETFVDLIVPVAHDVRRFEPSATADEVCRYLNSWTD